ncbi:hypothetical protein [Niallia sp. 03133]|uniref:hypothetical protein n=1 Tax=Niallia sp. 03133 TaxID=3458060 RepID=UPI0040443B3E
MEELRITPEFIQLLRSCHSLSQAEFSFYMITTQSKLSELETGKRPITEYYENKISLAINRLQISSKELQHISELAQIAKQKQN